MKRCSWPWPPVYRAQRESLTISLSRHRMEQDDAAMLGLPRVATFSQGETSSPMTVTDPSPGEAFLFSVVPGAGTMETPAA